MKNECFPFMLIVPKFKEPIKNLIALWTRTFSKLASSIFFTPDRAVKQIRGCVAHFLLVDVYFLFCF